LDRAGTERRHRLRIQIKKLRYSLEFFRPLYSERDIHTHLQRLAEVQERFGRFNDLATATRLIAQCDAAAPADHAVAVARAGGLIVGWHAHAVTGEEQTLLEHWRAVRALKPFW